MGSSRLVHCGAELRLNTKDCCFICLKRIRPDLETTINLRSENDDNSLSALFRYLNINLEEPISQTYADSEPLSRPGRCDITARLCEDCSKINKRVQKLIQVLEVARMKIDYQINSIREKMRDAGRTPSKMLRYLRKMKSDPSKERIDRLRKRVSTKCNEVVRKSKPRVVVTRMASDMESSNDSSQYFTGRTSRNDTSQKTEREGSPETKRDSEFSPPVKRKHSQKRTNSSPRTSSIPKNPGGGDSDSYCKICRKTYNDRYRLKQHHKYVHLGIRNFSCELCDKKFGFASELKKHVDAVHYRRRFKCNVSGCIRNYSTIEYFKKHQKSAHPETVVATQKTRKEAKSK